VFAVAPTVSLPAETVISIAGVQVRNSQLLGLVGLAILFWLLFYTRRRVLSGRHTRLSLAILWAYEWLVTTTEEVLGNGDKDMARRIAPLGITMFLVIIINNWLELLPVVGTISWHGAPLFRGLAADLNVTFALAIITMVTAQIWAIRTLGFRGNLGRYIANPFTDPLRAFEGTLESIAEVSRFIALSMRLFGNIFGGEVLLAVIGYLSGWFAPLSLPIFMALELFVGTIQAYIFFMLTVAFIAIGVNAEPHEASATAAEH
jgi:F-type H+-transporting ATPase subunit a